MLGRMKERGLGLGYRGGAGAKTLEETGRVKLGPRSPAKTVVGAGSRFPRKILLQVECFPDCQ